MIRSLTVCALACVLSPPLSAHVFGEGGTITSAIDAVVGTRGVLDPTLIESLKQFDRTQVAAEIKARLQAPLHAAPNDWERDRAIFNREVRPTKDDMERFRRYNERVNLYRALAGIMDAEGGRARWLNDEVVETLHFGATQETEYVRAHVLETFLQFRGEMPQPFWGAMLQALDSTRSTTVSVVFTTLALTPRRDLLSVQRFWGFVVTPDQANPALWEDLLASGAAAEEPVEMTFFTLRLTAADALIRHCDLGEIVAAWRQATDIIGRRALALAVFRKLWNPDAAFHLAPVETQVEAIRLACQGIDGLPASWIAQSGFVLTLARAATDGTIQAEPTRTEIQLCLLHLKDLPEYADFADLIHEIVDRL